MNKKKNCLVGRDGEGMGAGILAGIMMIIFVVIIVVMVICTIGALIGLWQSLKNYVASFKENVIDSNREIPAIIKE